MKVMVELDDEVQARRALAELEAAGFDTARLHVNVSHPFGGGILVSLVASGQRLAQAFEILRGYDVHWGEDSDGALAH